MDSEEFRKYILRNRDKDEICPPPLDAQLGLNILIKHFLGANWYVTLPINQQQVNAEAVYQILRNYPLKKKSLLQKLFG